MSGFLYSSPSGGGGGGATILEVDFAGSGGALSNGTVSIGGVDWTVAGVGTADRIEIYASLADLIDGYDARLPIEMVMLVTEMTLFSGRSLRLLRTNSAIVDYDAAGWDFTLNSTAWSVYNTGGGSNNSTGHTTPPGRIGLISLGGCAYAKTDGDTTDAPVRPGELGTTTQFVVKTDRTVDETVRYGDATDQVRIYLRGLSDTCSITQDAGGLDMVQTNSTATIRKLWLFQ